MRVLVVGAGAVGQVYGYHLHAGGADVTFYVREKYRAELAAGFDLFALNRTAAARTAPMRFSDFRVIASASDIAKPFDQVWLTVSSPALRDAWLRELLAACGPDATIISLQPGLDDRQVVLDAGVAPERLVMGLISIISYHAPLPGETRFPSPGMAYWFPPLSPSLLSGPRAESAAAALRAGKQPAKRHADVQAFMAMPSAIMHAYLVALEASDWRFRDLFAGPHAQLAASAAREAMLALAAARSTRVPFTLRVLRRASIVRVGLWFARRIVPLPLETYFAAHFTKVGAQTRELVAGFLELAEQHGTPASALRSLVGSLREAVADDHGATG